MGEGETGYKPSEAEQQSEVPQIREGLSAVILPREIVTSADPDVQWESRAGTEEATMGKLNDFLEGLNQQGVDIVSVFDTTFDQGGAPGVVGGILETKKVAIVRKKSAPETPPLEPASTIE